MSTVTSDVLPSASQEFAQIGMRCLVGEASEAPLTYGTRPSPGPVLDEVECEWVRPSTPECLYAADQHRHVWVGPLEMYDQLEPLIGKLGLVFH
jgi:hypothetical protein